MVSLKMEEIKKACEVVDLRKIKKFINGCGNVSVNALLAVACGLGDRMLIDSMIKKGANDWNNGMIRALSNGRPNIAKMMIEKGADNWDLGTPKACANGYFDVVQFMIQKGCLTTSHYIEAPNFFLQCAWNAGHMNIVKLIISKGITEWYGGNSSKMNTKFVASLSCSELEKYKSISIFPTEIHKMMKRKLSLLVFARLFSSYENNLFPVLKHFIKTDFFKRVCYVCS